MKIYLCGPIDKCSSDEMRKWRNFLKEKYPHHHYYDPMDLEENFDVDEPSHTITGVTIEKEKEQIRDSDVILCYPWKPSSGSAMEVMYANTLAPKPQIVLVSQPPDYLSPWLKYHSDHVANSFTHAMEWIDALADKPIRQNKEKNLV